MNSHRAANQPGGAENSRGFASAPTVTPASSSVVSEVVRLRAENARLRLRVGDANVVSWGKALLAEVETESLDERRIFMLKSELCLAVRRRQEILKAVRARHEGLQRISSSARVCEALADGWAASTAETLAQAARPPTVPVSLSSDAALEAEQQVISASRILDVCARQGLDADQSAFFSRLNQKVQSCSLSLLEYGPDLPPTCSHQAAVARRWLRRHFQASAVCGTSSSGFTSAAPSNSCVVQVPDHLFISWHSVLHKAREDGALVEPLT